MFAEFGYSDELILTAYLSYEAVPSTLLFPFPYVFFGYSSPWKSVLLSEVDDLANLS